MSNSKLIKYKHSDLGTTIIDYFSDVRSMDTIGGVFTYSTRNKHNLKSSATTEYNKRPNIKHNNQVKMKTPIKINLNKHSDLGTTIIDYFSGVHSMDNIGSVFTYSTRDSGIKFKGSNVDNTEWNVKQTFSNNNKLTDIQLGIIYDVIKNGEFGLKFYNYNKDLREVALKDDYAFGINNITHDLGTLHLIHYELMKESPIYNDFMTSVFDYVNEGKVLTIQNQYRSKIRMSIDKSKLHSSGLHTSMTEADYILGKICNGKLYACPKNDDDMIRLSDLFNYALMVAYKLKHGIYTSYFRTNSSTDYISPKIKNVYNIILIPKDLQNKFNKPRKYFKELKEILKLNPDTGFYSYIIENNIIPVLCTHEYMIYDGKALSEVSIQCYKKGKCKYCGQELSAYHEQIKENLPPKVYDLIYKYMSTINENIEENSLIHSLFSLIYDSVKVNLNTKDIKNYTASVIAFTALYLYVVYIKTKDTINYNIQVNRFLDSIKKYWSEIGWTMDTVNNAINNTDIFSNMTNIESIIKDSIYTNDITFLDALPLSILFGKNVDPKNINDLEAKTKMQKLWKSGISNVEKFNEMFYKALLTLWKFTNIKQNVSDISKRNINVSYDLYDIKIADTKNGEKFFTIVADDYCPVSTKHNWNNKKCTQCGLNKDKSNIKEIYTKYQNIINNSYLQRPKVLPDDRFNISKLYNKSQIDNYKPSDLFEKYLIIENYVLQQHIIKSIDEGLYKDEIIKFISTMTTLDISEIDQEPAFIKKSLCFIIDKQIKPANEILNELKYIYFKVKNIDLLILQSN